MSIKKYFIKKRANSRSSKRKCQSSKDDVFNYKQQCLKKHIQYN